MKFFKRTVIFVFLFILLMHDLTAKENTSFAKKDHSVNLEILGSTFYYSFQYEQFVWNNLLVNVGLAFIPEYKIYIASQNQTYVNPFAVLEAPVSIQYSFPINNWGLDLGVGLLLGYWFAPNPWFEASYAFLHLGVRYYPTEHLLLKLYWNPQYNLYFPPLFGFAERVLPLMFGLSVGYAFQVKAEILKAGGF